MAYNAFISYSHAADDKLAPALQSALHRFAKPWYRLRQLHVFRDKTSLTADPGLWSAIENALRQSEWLLLLASPEAANSHWVQKEIGWWLENRATNRLLALLTEGDIVWEPGRNDFDWASTTALPRLLAGRFSEELLYVDLRWAKTEEKLSTRQPRFLDAVADIAAPLHRRPKEDLVGEDIVQHRRGPSAGLGPRGSRWPR